MRILIIGAGAIGQAFARHFHRGGAEVHLLVRPRQEKAARRGLPVYPLNERSFRQTPDRLHLEVHTDQDAALHTAFDVIVLSVSSTALRAGDWLARVGRDRGHAHILGLTGSVDDIDWVREHAPGAHVGWAMLSIISYTAPLPDAPAVEPGIAYWIPPLSRIALSGPDALMQPVIRVLSRGGMPVRRVDDVRADAAFASPILTQTIHALEVAGWSFTRLRRDPELLPLAVRAMHESWALAHATTGHKRPWAFGLIRPWGLRAVLVSSRWLVPFSLERFFAYHYTKVADQTLFLAHEHLRSGDAHDVPMPATSELVRRLEQARS